jgi:hypothetical protein
LMTTRKPRGRLESYVQRDKDEVPELCFRSKLSGMY